MSSTAALIAASTLFLSREAGVGHLVPPRSAELSELFLRALPQSTSTLLLALSRGNVRGFGRVLEAVSVPGIQLHYALRKAHIEQTARLFIGAGGEQLVVLGGGFDTLAFRLAEENPQVRFVEVDRPATQEVKRRALDQLAVPSNLTFLPLELPNERLCDALATHALFDTAARSLFVTEGLLMYLEAEAVESLFATIGRLITRGSLFVFTFMERDAAGRVAFRNQGKVVEHWLRLRGEPFGWGIARERVPALIAPLGFCVRELLTSVELHGRYLPAAAHVRVAEGECVCVAERT